MALIMRKLLNMHLSVWRVVQLMKLSYRTVYKFFTLSIRLFIYKSMRFDFRLANLIGFHNYLYYTSFMRVECRC